MEKAVLVLGVGDVGSAVAHALHRAGFAVALHDDPAPAHLRRGIAFADALWDGSAQLAGVDAIRVDDAAALRRALADRHAVAVTSAAFADIVAARPWSALVDARLRKRIVPPDRRGLAERAIGLGPGFAVGENCDIAVETSWEKLGAVVRQGATLPLHGEPRAIDGLARARMVYAPSAGRIATRFCIGAQVAAGEAVGDLDGHVVQAPMAGVLRGLVRDGVAVGAGAKLVEIDPRGDAALCFGLGERPLRIADSVCRLLASDADDDISRRKDTL